MAMNDVCMNIFVFACLFSVPVLICGALQQKGLRNMKILLLIERTSVWFYY